MNENLWRGRNCGCAQWTELNMMGFFFLERVVSFEMLSVR